MLATRVTKINYKMIFVLKELRSFWTDTTHRLVSTKSFEEEGENTNN